MLDKRKPFTTALLALSKSRKVLTALASLFIIFVVGIFPTLEPVQAELTVASVFLALVLIGGIAYEDAAQFAKTDKPLDGLHITDATRKTLYAILDEYFDQLPDVNDVQAILRDGSVEKKE